MKKEKKMNYQYYKWTFQTNGLQPFLFRGKTNDELLKSFRLNYEKALSPESKDGRTSKQLLNDLDSSLRHLFGMTGCTIKELEDFKFVEKIPVEDLKAASKYTVNKYKNVL